jgi:hypothetical protein
LRRYFGKTGSKCGIFSTGDHSEAFPSSFTTAVFSAFCFRLLIKYDRMASNRSNGFIRAWKARPETNSGISWGDIMKQAFGVMLAIQLNLALGWAQSPGDLKRYFEGRMVAVKIDMPATKDGVNIYPERIQPMKFDEYARLIKHFGVGIEQGDRVMVTKVHVKDKHVEFQLGGGGYGTFGDETEPSVYIPSVGKTEKEKRIEKELDAEKDQARRRVIREELDDLKKERQREERRLEAQTSTAVELGKQRIEKRRLHSGSRFNIRFESKPGSQQLTPAAIMDALSDYVEFPSMISN